MAETTTDMPAEEITVTREIRATPDRVFAVWTDPAQMMRWFGLPGTTTLETGFEPRVGGRWFSAARAPDGEVMRMEGEILEIVPARRLVQVWRSVAPDGTAGNETRCEVVFEPSAAGCRVTVRHSGIRRTPELFELGWAHSLDRIEALATA